ncbi:MAG: xanthine dehydrogenase family protein molybdopterin-binding subunit [Gemmatimonadetes bacterium]|nr:xanthine dehydrogenase family protein molybdopterin-binding subunit [Gemmatimonadota bacterium]
MARQSKRSTARRGRTFVETVVEVEGRTEKRVVELPAFEPAAWKADTALEIVGARVPRMDAHEKVTGRARYTADIALPGMLHALILRSPVAKGNVRSFDATAARAVPGVLDVLATGDAPPDTRLFTGKISYAGQPVGVICAETFEAAAAGARAMAMTFDAAPFAATFEAAVAPDAPLVRSQGNLMADSPMIEGRGDIEAGLRAADVTITREYRTPVQLHSAIEPHGAVAEWNADRVTIWESTQGIFRVREQVAAALGISQSNVRVIKHYMGGGFGAKNGAGAHTYIAALFARRTGRPVRCVLSRRAEQSDSGNRPATIQRVTLGAKKNGTLTAIVLSADIPLGVSGWEGGPAQIYHELYACPNVRTEETFAWVNSSGMQAFRAPGYAEGAFGLESAMNALARELGMDPLALRRRNFTRIDLRRSQKYSGNALRECYDEGARKFGWASREERRQASANPAAPASVVPSSSVASVRRGFGMAAQLWPTGGGPPSYAQVRINNDASIDVLAGTQDLGTGARTVLAQIAAEALGAKLSDVRSIIGDTETLPYAGNSWGSMTTPSVGPAARMAAEDARRLLLEAAAPMFDVQPGDLETKDSRIVVRDTDRSMTFAEVTKSLGDVMIVGRGSRGPNPDDVTIATFGAQFAEVEVDVETGIVRVLRIVAAHDAGRIINPTLAESQLEGGIIQGLGYALFEERILDRATGVQLNADLHDYRIPTMADIPAIDAFFVGTADTVANHTGARGLAEPPIIPTAPAIAAAVADAIGAEMTQIPLTPWRVLGALENQRG